MQQTTPGTVRQEWFDSELRARLSRLEGELALAGQSADDGSVRGRQLEDVRSKLTDIPKIEDQATCLLVIHEIEAELCLLKPDDLLYPTWTRLRERLSYRFTADRRHAWQSDISRLISPEGEVLKKPDLRQRLRQLTLELHESATGYNRLAEERATVVRGVNKLGLKFIVVFLVMLLICFAAPTISCTHSFLAPISMAASIFAGCTGATFSRLTTIRSERTRYEFVETFKLDLWARVSLGAASAVIIGAALLSGVLPIRLPEDEASRLGFYVTFGFAGGFSDRLLNQTLARIIGARAPRSREDAG